MLERNVPKRQLGKGALVAVGIHAAVLAWVISRPKVREPKDGRSAVFVTFLTRAGPVSPPLGDAKLAAMGKLGPAEGARSESETGPVPQRIDRPRAARSSAPARASADVRGQPRSPPAAAGPADSPPPAEIPPATAAGPQHAATAAAISTEGVASAGARNEGWNTTAAGLGGGAAAGTPAAVAGGAAAGTMGGTAGDAAGTPLTAPRADITSALPFGEGMTRPVLLHRVDPTYTHEALAAKVQGLMLVKCIITTRGTLESCRVVKGLPHMNEAVLAALEQWKYSPVLFQGRAVNVEYVIPVRLVMP